MSLVVGADYSTRYIDLVLLDEDTLAATWRRYELEGHDAFERARSIRDLPIGSRAYGAPSDWDDVLACGIEEPPYVKGNPKTLRDLARVQGAVLARIPRSLLVKPWTPSEWRKAVGLPGNASKRDVERFCDVKRGARPVKVDLWPHDACDAYCIALATLRALERKEAV